MRPRDPDNLPFFFATQAEGVREIQKLQRHALLQGKRIKRRYCCLSGAAETVGWIELEVFPQPGKPCVNWKCSNPVVLERVKEFWSPKTDEKENHTPKSDIETAAGEESRS